MRTKLFAILMTLGAVGALAQSDEPIHHNNVTFGVGPAMPEGNSTAYLNTAPIISVGYGYRFNRLFQADAGFQLAFGAANNQNPEQTDVGVVQGGDHEYMLPLGGRIYLPLHLHRIEASVGAGGVYLHYSETAPSNPYYGSSGNCYTCTSRGGWGGYGLGNVSYFLDENHSLHVGVTFQYIAGSTNGQPVASIPAVKTTDHWANIFFEAGLSF